MTDNAKKIDFFEEHLTEEEIREEINSLFKELSQRYGSSYAFDVMRPIMGIQDT